mmetsp:Transcript_23489/g.48802  ORF Transcript_23489/g.48802 Transcript_23489/m.48802 type:complete len:120 (+) Transcript_23489:110-469(+)
MILNSAPYVNGLLNTSVIKSAPCASKQRTAMPLPICRVQTIVIIVQIIHAVGVIVTTIHILKSNSSGCATPNHHGNNLIVGISSMTVNPEWVGCVSYKREDHGRKHFIIDVSNFFVTWL